MDTILVPITLGNQSVSRFIVHFCIQLSSGRGPHKQPNLQPFLSHHRIYSPDLYSYRITMAMKSPSQSTCLKRVSKILINIRPAALW